LVVLLIFAVAGCSAGDEEPGGRNVPGVDGVSAGSSGAPQDGFGDGPVMGPASTPGQSMIGDDPNLTPAGGSIEPILIDDCGPGNASGVSDADIQLLMAVGTGPLRMLYPYDATVFPRGLLAPLLMWEGDDADAVYVHIKSTHFEYHGCLIPTGPNQVEIPQSVWEDAGARTLGTGDPYSIELSTISGGVTAGPVVIQVTIAQATIKGSIYYNSYSSALGGLGGNVLRIPPGGIAEAFVSNECNGCHSVSADGSRLISQTLGAGGRAYQLTAGGATNPPAMPGAQRIAYAALYPDGSRYLAGYADGTTEVARAALTGAGAPPAAQLFETDTGNMRTATGVPDGAMMPTFSPDGSLLVFTDLALNAAHGLAIVDYDVTTHTGSGYRVLHEDANLRPGWPFVLPDNGGVIFIKTNGGDFSGEGAGLLGLVGLGPIGDLFVVDLDTGTTNILAQAMGYNTPQDAATDNTYLPFGASELHKNYFPTVSPVAAGGYFWVLFDAVRNYGNLGVQRQLWVTAVSISPNRDYTTDRSHPAFYLPGQEFGTGNHRAFAALDACVQDGDDCLTGIDCCGGFCFITDDLPEFAMPIGTCNSEPPSCARKDERCAGDVDCCAPEPGQPADSCIAGYCAFIPVE